MSQDLQDRIAIITGGSKGYGAGIAEALARRGADVWIAARGQESLDAAAERLGVHGVRADVTRGDDWDRLFERVLGQAGRLDILVNNAGAGIRIAPLAEQTDAEIEQAVAVNLTSSLLGCRRAAAVMRQQGSGTIVNVSSACQCEAWPGWAAYSAAKAGLAQAGKCLYTELRAQGVRVTTIVPSWGATDFLRAANLPARDPQTAAKCIQPTELGKIVADICALPGHLEVQELILWPLVQEVVPL